MKNQLFFATGKRLASCLLIVGLGISSISLTYTSPRESDYFVINPKISLSGFKGNKDWKAVLDSFSFNANFIASEGGLENISDFQFVLPVNRINIDNCKEGALIQKTIQNGNCSEIIFSQKNLMILPIMKMAQLIGDMKMMNGIHSVPMQIEYQIDKDQNIKVVAKQFIMLSQFGITTTPISPGTKEDIMNINIEFMLVKKQLHLAEIVNNN